MRTIQSALEEITYANGYNTNVRKVERTRTLPLNHDSPPQIYMIPDQSIVLWRGTHHRFEKVPIDIWIADLAENGQDESFNMFLGDVQRRLMACGILVDPTYPVDNWAQIYVVEEPSTPLYTDLISGVMIGVVRYTFEWWRTADPRLWDSADILVPANA